MRFFWGGHFEFIFSKKKKKKFASSNETSLKSQKFTWKNIDNWQSPENDFCLVFWFLVFGYWVVQNFFFLVFLYEKNQGGSYEVAFIPALWMVSSQSLKRLYPN